MSDITPSLPAIDHCILTVRGRRVILDVDLAALYNVEIRDLYRAVKLNFFRFPDEFIFQLTTEEYAWAVRCQARISKWRHGRRFRPCAVTEEGVVMLSSVLNSRRAFEVNIEIMRVFVRCRHILAGHGDGAHKLDAMEALFNAHHHENHARHEDHEAHITAVFEALRHFLDDDTSRKPPSRFGSDVL